MVEIKDRLYRCRLNYALSNLIVDNGLEDLWRRENPDFSEFTHYEKSSGIRSRIGGFYSDIKIASNTKINRNAFFINTFRSETKIGKDSWYFNNSFLSILNYKEFSFLLKTQKATTLQQVPGGKTLNLVLKKILDLFLKIQEKY